MDDHTWTAAIEAQFLMGHRVPAAHMALDRTTITGWSWDVDEVRQALHVPADELWDERVLALEMHGLASFSMDVAPVTWDTEENAHEIPGWQDEAREKWGSLDIHAAGVLRLAELYGRPFVKLEESPALLAHWRLVQEESDARLRRLGRGYDQAQWEREWPERAMLHKALMAQWEHEGDD